jgi:hypothetical protein
MRRWSTPTEKRTERTKALTELARTGVELSVTADLRYWEFKIPTL